jgi:hypothetical protein
MRSSFGIELGAWRMCLRAFFLSVTVRLGGDSCGNHGRELRKSVIAWRWFRQSFAGEAIYTGEGFNIRRWFSHSSPL